MSELEPKSAEVAARPRKRSNAVLVALPLVSCLGWMLFGGLLSTLPGREVAPTGKLVVRWTSLGPEKAEGVVYNAGTTAVEGPAMYVQFPRGIGGRTVTFPQHTTMSAWQHTLMPGASEPFSVSVREVGILPVPAVLAITNGHSSSETSFRRYAYQQELALRPVRPRRRMRR